MGMMDYFKIVLTVQLLYAVGITMLLYALSFAPASISGQLGIQMFQDLPNTNAKEIQEQVQGGFTNQTGFPSANVGSLVFFSGMILVDLLANFVLAVPSMFQLLMSAFFMFVPIDAFLQAQITIFATAIVAIIYILGLLGLFTNIATGRLVT